MLYYFAGFNGYLLLGHYLRNHDWMGRQLRGIGIPMFAIGYAVTFIGFRHMISLPDFTEEIQGLLFPPDSPHIVSAVRECENKRDNQQHFAFSPSHSLLVPQSGDDTKNGKDKSNHVQGHLPVAGGASMLQLTVLHAVAHVDVQTDEHPQHQAYPCIGRKEQHHAKASKNTQYGDKWNKWGFKGTGHVRHGSAYYQYSGTD